MSSLHQAGGCISYVKYYFHIDRFKSNNNIRLPHSGICINFSVVESYMIDRLINKKKKNAWETITANHFDKILHIKICISMGLQLTNECVFEIDYNK